MKTFEHCCEALKEASEDPQSPITFILKFREYGVRVLDGGSSSMRIAYCPWSGHKLPETLRSEWFARVRAKGIDPAVDTVPPEFLTDAWHNDYRSDE